MFLSEQGIYVETSVVYHIEEKVVVSLDKFVNDGVEILETKRFIKNFYAR